MLVYQAARTTVSIKISMTSRFRIFLVILGVGRISSLETLHRCPPGWLLNGQSCWMPLLSILHILRAQEECQKIGSNLTVPNSKAENDFVAWLFQETWPNAIRRLWLGCTIKPPNNTLTCLGSPGLGYQPHSIESDINVKICGSEARVIKFYINTDVSSFVRTEVVNLTLWHNWPQYQSRYSPSKTTKRAELFFVLAVLAKISHSSVTHVELDDGLFPY